MNDERRKARREWRALQRSRSNQAPPKPKREPRRKRKRARRESALLPIAERKTLGARAPEIPVGKCPECGGLAVGKSGRWRCRRGRKRFGFRFDVGQKRARRDRDSAVRYLACGASGRVMQDGSLAVLAGGRKTKEEEPDE